MRRLRLENIARQLFSAANADITTLALEHGYASSQALAKAFRAHFGMTARDIRACRDFESRMQAMQNSKIGYLLHKSRHAAHAGNGDTAPVINPQEQAMTTDMQTTTLAPCTVAYIRVTGEYGKNYEPATNRLYQWAGAHGLAGRHRNRQRYRKTAPARWQLRPHPPHRYRPGAVPRVLGGNHVCGYRRATGNRRPPLF